MRRLMATTSVGYIPVKIYARPNLCRDEGAVGRFRMAGDTAIIEMEPNQYSSMRYDTLVHELVHVADELWTLKLGERKTRELATSLCQALRDLKKPKKKGVKHAKKIHSRPRRRN